MAGAHDDVSRMEGATMIVGSGCASFELDGPACKSIVVFRRAKFRAGPDIQFQDFGIRFEPLCDFVFGAEDWPMLWERDIGYRPREHWYR
ncbi:hypothetical protein AC578_5023 [Pseudocercospora eumusae]|uniref:Uncharacterized protein n=1 Tax=Pseudocercospora eumusae TaxID=321146 RepID=A0A139H656_9PEZI|nr:hypothetical protein AC578_5023 [Pseudocercospora eumusae]